MSKIFEALEQAEKDRKELPQGPRISEITVPEDRQPEIYSFELDIEEEMLSLYRAIDSLLPDHARKLIQFIGSSEGEGTSTVAREFARMAITKLGQSVLLLDADRYNPTQHFFCNVAPENCLEDVLQNGKALDRALYQVGNLNLYVCLISRNSNAAQGTQVFDLPLIDGVWEALRERFDLVVVDSPPASTSPDGLAIFKKADGVVLVVEADKTRWPVVDSVKERILKHGGNLLGVVLNKRRYYIPDVVYRRL